MILHSAYILQYKASVNENPRVAQEPGSKALACGWQPRALSEYTSKFGTELRVIQKKLVRTGEIS